MTSANPFDDRQRLRFSAPGPRYPPEVYSTQYADVGGVTVGGQQLPWVEDDDESKPLTGCVHRDTADVDLRG
jgi:hypothetical protein